MPMMPFKNILLMLSTNYKMLFHVELSIMLSDSLTFSRYTITSSALCRAIKYYNIFKIIDVASYFPYTSINFPRKGVLLHGHFVCVK